MAQILLRGLQGLRGLNSRQLSAYRDSLYDLGLINVHTPISTVHSYMDNMAKLDEFRTKYVPQLIQLAQEGQIPTDLLNTTDVNQMEYLASAVDIEKEFENKYNPYVVDYIDGAGKPHYVVDYTDNGGRPHYKVDPNKGMGNELTYLKYKQMTPEGKKALLDSVWKTDPELRKQHDDELNRLREANKEIYGELGKKNFFLSLSSAMAAEDYGTTNPELISKKEEEDLKLKQVFLQKRNLKLLEKILADDLKRRRGALSDVEQLELQQLNNSNLKDSDVDKLFLQSISLNNGYGNPLLKAFIDDKGKQSSALKDFNRDEKLKYLAMQRALQKDGNMDPLSANEFLINYAKDYINDHTSTTEYLGKLIDDIGISVASYTADKVNGFIGLGKMIDGMAGNKYSVYMDLSGKFYENKEIGIDGKGRAFVKGAKDEEGNPIYVNKQNVTSAQLYALGKDTDGSDYSAFLNNKFWDDAEQYGTLSKELLQKYAKTGYSPEKVIYKAGDEKDLFYETAKMTSFGIADGLVTMGLSFIGAPFGAIAKGTSAMAKAAGVASNVISGIGRWGGPALSTAGIANAYARGAYLESAMNNLNKLELATYDHANAIFVDKYKNNTDGFKNRIDAETKEEFKKLKALFDAKLKSSGQSLSKEEYEALKQALMELAADNVSSRHIEGDINSRMNSTDYYNAVNEVTSDATLGAQVAGVTDALKYLPVNFAGHRAFLFKNKSRMINDAQRNILDRVKDAGKQLAYEPKIFLQNAGRKAKEFGKFAGKQAFGGAWTNYTDEWHVAGGKRLNDDKFSAYLSGMYDDKGVNATYSLGDAYQSYILGTMERIPEEDALWAGLVGALGSVFSFASNFDGIGRLAFDKNARKEFKRNWNLLRQGAVDSQGNRDADAAELMNRGDRRRARGDAFMLLFNTFVNNGVLQEYEAKKLAEADVMQNIKTINDMLDEYDNFEAVEDALALDLAEMDATNEKDKRALEFLKALKSIHLLNSIAAEETEDSTVFDRLFAKSSAVLKARKGWEDIQKIANNDFTEEEAEQYLEEYYNNNKDISRTEENDALAMQEIQENALMLLNTSKIYDLVSKEVDDIDKKYREESGNKGSINPKVKEKLILRLALDQFIEDEINETEEITTGRKITDFSELEIPIDVFGSQEAANSYIKGNETAIRDIKEQEKSTEEDITKSREKYVNKLKDELNTEEDIDPDTYTMSIDEEAKLPQEVADEINDLKKEYISNKLLKVYYEQARKSLEEKNKALQKASETYKSEDEILTADEILALNPEARAIILNPQNSKNYSEAQNEEIRKATKRINKRFKESRQGATLTIRLLRDQRTGIDRLLDLANLMLHKRANERAYNMMSENIEAAQFQLEALKFASGALNSYAMLEQYATNIDKHLGKIRDASLKELGKYLYDSDVEQEKRLARETIRKNLSVINPLVLQYVKDNIDRFSNALEYQDILQDALEFADLKTSVQRSIDNNTDLKPEERRLFKRDIDRLFKQSNVTTKLDAIEAIQEILASERLLFQRANNAKDKGSHAFMTKAFENVLNDILKTELQKDTTKEVTTDDLKKIEAEQKLKRDTFTRIIKSAENLPRISTDEKGNQHVGNYKIDTTTYKSGKLKIATLTHEGDPFTMWEVSGEQLLELGITPQQILGNRSNWENNTLLYDTLLNSISKGEIAIESISIDGNGETMINLAPNDTLYGVEGLTVLDQGASNKLFNYLTDGIKPEDFVSKKEEKKEEDKSKEKLPQEGEIEDDKDEVDELMKDENEEGDEVMGDNLEGDEAMYDNPDELVSNEEVDAALQGVGVTYLESPSVEKQGETLEGDKNIEIDDLPKDTTDNGNNLPPNDATNMLGNPFYLYDVDSLKDSGFRKLVRRKILRKNSPYEKAMMWMDKNGVKLQEIIDNELHRIIQHNPKLHFLKFKMQNHNEFDDHLLSDLCPLCVEYTLTVANIHDDSRGGVFTANGKLYLMVGFAGFDTKSRALGDAYRAFLEDYKAQTKRYMDAHPNERAFVNPNMYTEVLYLSSGRLVGETESDAGRTIRSIVELLSGEDKAIRNPQNLKLLTLKWMIQEGMIDNAKSRVLKINYNSSDEIWHTPIDAPSNKGAVFAMIPGCNGHYLPLYINPVTYDELNEGTLKDLITKELLKLASPDLDTRRLAINKLLKILVLNENKNIWVGDEKHPSILSIKNGVIETKFNLDSTDTHVEDIIKAIENAGFRVNITQSVLLDNSMIKLYAEAGALSTDIAVLGAVNASYTVYLVGKDGKPIKSNVVNNNVLGLSALKILEKREEKSGLSVRYGTNNLLYRKRGDSWYTIDEGSRIERRIEDPRLKQQLELKSYIDKNGLTPSVSKGKFDYYIIDNNTEHPRVLMMNKETQGIVDMDASSAINIIEESKLKATKEAKNKAAKLASDNIDENDVVMGEMKDVDLDLGEEELTDEDLINLMTGQWGESVEQVGEMLDIDLELEDEILPPPSIEEASPTSNVLGKEQEIKKEEPRKLEPKDSSKKKDGGINSTRINKTADELGNHNVASIMSKRDTSRRLVQILESKGMSKLDARNLDKVIEWLESKSFDGKPIPVDNITDVDNWLHMVEECK